MKKLFILFVSILFFSFVYQNYPRLYPAYWPKPNYNFSKNPLQEKKIQLGRTLFYETMLSKDNTISCESCHSPYSAFSHIDHPLSHGIRDSVGQRNAPALMNLAWQKSFMWDGAVKDLYSQALSPISHPAEMGSSIDEVLIKLNTSFKYRNLFFQSFGDSLANKEKILSSMAQFMLTLISKNAKYDSVMSKETTFTQQEKNGYQLFLKNCNTCHTEPLFTNGEFENNGLPLDSILKDTGRKRVTSNKSDAYQFKVPTLRNIEYTFPYMHDGRFKKLSEVLNHYSNGIYKSETLSPHLNQKINLTSNEKVDLIAFLLTLSDKKFIFNPNFTYPK